MACFATITWTPFSRREPTMADEQPSDEHVTWGATRWSFSAGYMPTASTGREPDFTSRDELCLLNASPSTACAEVTVHHEDGAPVGPTESKWVPGGCATCGSTTSSTRKPSPSGSLRAHGRERRAGRHPAAPPRHPPGRPRSGDLLRNSGKQVTLHRDD